MFLGSSSPGLTILTETIWNIFFSLSYAGDLIEKQVFLTINTDIPFCKMYITKIYITVNICISFKTFFRN
jgi:hypothetical protein